jgi:hypothetical protein
MNDEQKDVCCRPEQASNEGLPGSQRTVVQAGARAVPSPVTRLLRVFLQARAHPVCCYPGHGLCGVVGTGSR